MLWNVQKNVLQNMEQKKLADYIKSHLKTERSSFIIAEKIRLAARQCSTYNEYQIFKQLTEAFLGMSIADIVKNEVDFDAKNDEYHYK